MTTLDIKQFGKIAVLMGGRSAEREISLKSGQAVLKALENSGVDVEAVDLGHCALKSFMDHNYDGCFIALHGRGGEDGTIQGFLKTIELPFTGSGVEASALGMDKIKTKQVWAAHGLNTPKFEIVDANVLPDMAKAQDILDKLGGTVIVKPAQEGSSIGMSKVNNAEELLHACQIAAEYDRWILIETWIYGKEYTCAILDDQALPLIRLETARDFYDFTAKYENAGTRYHCPCGLDEAAEAQMQAQAKEAFNILGCRGWGRVDFMRNEKGENFLLEVNTVPGMTEKSLVPMAAKAAGISFESLCIKILQSAKGAGGQ